MMPYIKVVIELPKAAHSFSKMHKKTTTSQSTDIILVILQNSVSEALNNREKNA